MKLLIGDGPSPFRSRALGATMAVALLLVLYNVIANISTANPPVTIDQPPSEPPPVDLPLPPCWVTGISTPNNAMYLLSSLMLGHSLRRHGNTPNAKLLLLTTKANWSPPIAGAISQLFDDVLTFPVHPIPGRRSAITSEREFLFKMWAFTLHDKCSTVAWLGADTLAIRDVRDVISCWPLPCGAPDLTLWKFYQLSPAINGDIVTFTPSPELYEGLIKAWAETPTTLLTNWREGGPFDQGVINRYFKGNMTILPWFYNVQPKALLIPEGGARGTDAAKLTDMWSLLHFSNTPKPWDTTPPVPKPNATLSADEQFRATTLSLWRDGCRSLVDEYPDLKQLGPCKTGAVG
jgi:hypothetical protein